MRKVIIYLSILSIIFTACSTQKANAQEKFWCIASMELMYDFPDFNNPELSEEYGNQLISTLKQYSETYKISITQYYSENSKENPNYEPNEFINLIKKDDTDSLKICKIWSEINDTNFEQYQESRQRKDNSK